MSILQAKDLIKTYGQGSNAFNATNGISLEVNKGEFVAIVGTSGSGKTTLLHMLGGLDRPTSGSVIIDGKDIFALKDDELTIFRRRKIGFIFQAYNLVPVLNVYENTVLPIELDGEKVDTSYVEDILSTLGLSEKKEMLPNKLSGGQQQRVAIARALATNPKVLLCDEATSALDPKTTNEILELIRDINERMGVTVVVITHSMSVVESICKHVAILDGGCVAETGLVSEIFSQPKTDAAKRLVFPEGHSEESVVVGREGERFIRVVFNGADITGTPLIARMAVEKGIEANISAASTRNIGKGVFGSMLLGITGGDEAIRTALEYLNVNGVVAEEVNVNA
jgi:D-methionine transport system ATP-binding protein